MPRHYGLAGSVLVLLRRLVQALRGLSPSKGSEVKKVILTVGFRLSYNELVCMCIGLHVSYILLT